MACKVDVRRRSIVRIDRSTIKTAGLVLRTLAFVGFPFFSTANAQQPLPEGPKPKNQAQTKLPSESSWPRTFTSGTNTLVMRLQLITPERV